MMAPCAVTAWLPILWLWYNENALDRKWTRIPAMPGFSPKAWIIALLFSVVVLPGVIGLVGVKLGRRWDPARAAAATALNLVVVIGAIVFFFVVVFPMTDV